MARMSREDAVAWVKEHDGAGWNDASKATGVPRTTLQQWCREDEVEKKPAPGTPPMVAALLAREAVESLPDDDRLRLIAQARSLMATADRLRAKLDTLMDLDGTLDDDDRLRDCSSQIARISGAIANTARALESLLRAFPGLMAEVRREDDRDEDAVARRMGETYGIPESEPPEG